ncbi:MAG: hypothetical protein VW907_00610 [Opitutae bacterium]
MAEIVRTIGSGRDYSTIAAWEAGNTTGGWDTSTANTDIWKGVIMDASAFDERVVISATTGTRSSSSYQWLTVDSSVRHAGVPGGTNYARLDSSTLRTAISIQDDYFRLSDLEITGTANDGGGSSILGGVSVTANHVLIEKCMIWQKNGQSYNSPADKEYYGITNMGSDSGDTIYIDNCLIFGWATAGVMDRDGAAATFYIDYCTICLNGDGDEEAGYTGNLGTSFSSTNNSTYNLYNNCFAGIGGPFHGQTRNTSVDWEIYNQGNSTGNYAGSYNGLTSSSLEEISSQNTSNTMSNWVYAAGGVTTSTASTAFIFTDLTFDANDDPSSIDFTPVNHANNALLSAGTNRIGSEPDSRQDFSVDLAGSTRSATNTDLGAITLVTSTVSDRFKFYSNNAWSGVKPMKYWNGTQWQTVSNTTVA